MPKPGGCHSSGISLGDVLRLPSGIRHGGGAKLNRALGRNSLAQAMPQTPGGTAASGRHAYAVAARGLYPTAQTNIVSFAAGRQCRWSTCTERENLAGDAKGKGTSGSNREAESTDAPERGGLPRSSVEAG